MPRGRQRITPEPVKYVSNMPIYGVIVPRAGASRILTSEYGFTASGGKIFALLVCM